MNKTCSKCKENKDISQFNLHRKEPDGHYSQCKTCSAESNRNQYKKDPQKWKDYAKKWKLENPEKVAATARKSYARRKVSERNYRIKKTYGITQEDYDRMYAEQNGKCAICGQKSEKNFHIDHDHDTGEVRGLLCNKCNKALGFVNDSPTILERMIRYINGHRHS